MNNNVKQLSEYSIKVSATLNIAMDKVQHRLINQWLKEENPVIRESIHASVGLITATRAEIKRELLND